MADQEPPDHTEDPRKQGTGQGYPETGHAGATPREGAHEGPGTDTGDGADAPATSTEQEADREASTGNPDAAG